MRILLTNDDGIHSPALAETLKAITAGPSPIATDCMVVAPLTVQSATGHGVTFRQPLIIKEVDAGPTLRGIAVDGRPADCVKLALSELWPQRFGKGTRPDLVVSGMNMGANVGINVLYSGTCAAALEAAFLGVPAIALSLHHGDGNPRYDVAARHAAETMRRVLAAAGGLPAAGSCISINVPRTEAPGPCPPVAVCGMNTHGLVDSFRRNVNPLGETYYWSAGTPMEFHATEPDSDVQQLLAGKVTVTPLKFDLTRRDGSEGLDSWRKRLG